jgi:hypothetical protein
MIAAVHHQHTACLLSLLSRFSRRPHLQKSNLTLPTSSLKLSPIFSILSKLFTAFRARDPLFSTLSDSFVKKHLGWVPHPQLKEKNEANIRKTSSRPPSLPLPQFSILEACSVLVIPKRSLRGPMTSPCNSSIALATSRTLKGSTTP